MAQFVIANNVNTQLASALPSSGAGSTTVVLASSANLPTLNTSIGQMMPLTLNDAATGAIYETMYVTAISGATLTVLRGQEGTSALNWNVGDLAFCGPTAGTVGLTTMRTQYQASASFSSSQTLTAAIAGESVGFTGTSASVFSMPGQSTVPNLTPTAVYNDGTATLTLTANGSDKFVVATGQVTSIVMQPGDDLTFYASTTANLWTTASGSALRQYEPLVVGAAIASQHAVQLGQATGRLLNVQIFTSSGTYTPSSSLVTSVVVEMVGGGGGGGGCASATTGLVALGGSGGGGGYAKARLISGFSGATVVVGASGTGGAAGVNNGGTGGASSFAGTAVVAQGGAGGVGSPANTPPFIIQGSSGAGASTGNIEAKPGDWSTIGIAIASNGARSGSGGASEFGIGANGVTGGNGSGATATSTFGYGGGGTGGVALSGGTAFAGGPGGPGKVIVWEYS